MDIRTHHKTGYCTRELLVDGQEVCWLNLVDYTMRVGRARVRMAGIADVMTRSEHRMKGYMRVLFQDTLHYMADEGYDVSMLFGIPNFYHKFGYAMCLPFTKVTVKTRDAELSKSQTRPVQVRPFTPADLPAIADLYNRANATRTCSLVRDRETYRGLVQHILGWKPNLDVSVFMDGQSLTGYAAWEKSDEAVTVVEVEAADRALYPALLAHATQQAVDKRCETITFIMPSDHPFALFLQRFGCESVTTCPRNVGGMLRITNQAGQFEKLRPELERRAGMSPVRVPERLVIRTDLGQTVLTLGGQGCVELSLPQDKLTQLVTGYRTAGDLLDEPEVEATPGSEPVLDALFPAGHPYVWQADHF